MIFPHLDKCLYCKYQSRFNSCEVAAYRMDVEPLPFVPGNADGRPVYHQRVTLEAQPHYASYYIHRVDTHHEVCEETEVARGVIDLRRCNESWVDGITTTNRDLGMVMRKYAATTFVNSSDYTEQSFTGVYPYFLARWCAEKGSVIESIRHLNLMNETSLAARSSLDIDPDIMM
jgi:hypothetical protein